MRHANRATERRREIAGVASLTLSDALFPGPILEIAEDEAAEAIRSAGAAVVSWRRFAGTGATATPWPADGAFAGAVIRLPGGWDAFRMVLHAACARLPAGAPIWIYGGSEEGIVSVPNHLDGLADGVETVALKKRTRVLRLVRSDASVEGAPAKGGQTDWRSEHDIAVPGVGDPLRLVFYPGCFAHGRLDEGTRLLLENLPAVKEGARVLDFACGTGVIAAAVRARTPDARLTLLDADALALDAAKENVAGAEFLPGDGMDAVDPAARYDLIASNPPIHVGRQEDFSVLTALLEVGLKRLRPKGALVFVVQRTAGVGRLISAQKRKSEMLAETPAFQVWRIAV
jgi:16S rRNA (guanine1207-N2)-methyltransferase